MNSTSLTPFNLATAAPPRADTIPTYTPALEDERTVRDALAFLVIKAPFFAHLIYNEMLIAYCPENGVIPWAATDARTIFVNIVAMKKAGWSLANIAFVLAHECAHGFLMDLIMAVRFRADEFVITAVGQLPYYPELMNMAEDYRINAMLVEAKCGKMPNVGLYDKSISEKGMEAAVEIYAKLYQQAKKGGGGGQGSKPGYGTMSNQSSQGFDIHLGPSAKAAKQDPAKMQQAVAAAAAAAEATGQGTIPSAIRRLLGDILDPKVSWQDHLRTTVIRKGGDPLYDWRYLDRHWASRSPPQYFAKQSHSGAGCIVIVGDTSGSINGPMLQRFFAEMNGIVADLNPAECHVLWCDAHLHRVDTLEEVDDLLEYKEIIENDGGPGGGGGTSFAPPFQWVEEQGLVPDMLIYLTDTYGTFPKHEPDYPVIWASIIKAPTVPWGEVVEVEL